MGTVRREGDWRLEKRGEGIYEVTFRREPQVKIFTEDASQRGQYSVFDTIPVHDVESYPEAEGIFEEKAHGPPPLGMQRSGGSSTDTRGSRGGTQGTEGLELADITPGLLAVAFIVAGIFMVYIFWGTSPTSYSLMGVGFVAVGIIPLAYATFLFKTEGWRDAWRFLATDLETMIDGGTTATEDSTEKTPPAPEPLKNELFFERADRQCEYCGESVDQPDVHHIVPRSEGGLNERSNLIVLCPNCHRKADSGLISRSKLRYQLD